MTARTRSSFASHAPSLASRADLFASRAAASTLALAFLALGGCDSAPPVVMPDAAIPDAGPPDAGPPFACERAMTVDGTMGTTTVTFDTTMTTTRPRDLGIGCGNDDPELRWAPQEVIEFRVPGTGQVAVEIDTSGAGTDSAFNTVVQVRTACDAVPTALFPPVCFDDVGRERRASGGVTAMGGDTLYIYVTGFSEPPAGAGVDTGTVQVDITVRANAAPSVDTAALILTGADTLIQVDGVDADGDVLGVALNFLGPTGALLDIYGDGEATMDGDVYVVFFSPRPTATSFEGRARVDGTMVGLAAYLRAVNASAAIFRVFDGVYATSPEIRVPVTDAEIVGLGEACDPTRLCADGLVCNATTMVCDASPALLAACMAATEIVIATPTDTAVTESVVSTTRTGAGSFTPSCVAGAPGAGRESVYRVAVPAGAFDLIATTDAPGTMSTDTILYTRSMCVDPASETGCNDDIAAMMLRSRVEIRDVAEGDHFLYVDVYNGGAAPFELAVTLRPVLMTGAACDMTGAANRCATGTCTAGMCP